MFFLTCVQALRSWVALPVALTAPELHQLHVELIQNTPFDGVHRVGELWGKTPGQEGSAGAPLRFSDLQGVQTARLTW